MGNSLTQKDISDEGARQVIKMAVGKAREIGTKMDIAIKKAKTARYFDMPTGEIGKLSQPGGPLYNIEHSNGGLISFPGGVPLKDKDGAIIGAIGVSGSSVEDDHAVAMTGAEALLG